MNLLGRDYERIAMCSHPQGTHEHVPLKSGEDPPETCFADCDCVPVVFVRADLHRGAVEAERKRMRAALLDYATGHSQAATTLMLRALEAASPNAVRGQ